MNKTFNILKGDEFINELSEMNCGKKQFTILRSENFEILFEETQPIDGYKPPDKFPKCCHFHSGIHNKLQEWFEKFPNCCPKHQKLLQTHWFNKQNYKDVAKKVVTQLSYTEYHISIQIDIPEWYKDITDYIEYNVYSFGQLPDDYGSSVGLDSYLKNLKHWINTKDKEGIYITKEKRLRLIEFIQNYYTPKSTNKIDLNILNSTYQKWIKIFPFELSYFCNKKKHYENLLPIIDGNMEYNKYLGLSKGKLLTQSKLIDVLVNTTTYLLQSIDSVELFDSGLISDLNKHRLELLQKNHRITQTSLVGNFLKSEMRYITILKKWLSNEEDHFKKLKAHLINDIPNHKILTSNTFNNMKYFDEFIIEVQTLEIKEKELYLNGSSYIKNYTPEQIPGLPYKKAIFLDLSHYDQFRSQYESNLKRLQQLAVNEILLLSIDQIRLLLKRLEPIKKSFSKFWDLHKENYQSFHNGTLSTIDLEVKLYPLFIVSKPKTGNISQDFLNNFVDAIMFKQGALLGFESQIKDCINSLENRSTTKETKFSFIKEQLRPKILEIANLNGYSDPIIYLNDLLEKVNGFNDIDFTRLFYLDVHYLCQENADKFWNEGHRQKITKWLKQAPIITEIFETTWTEKKVSQQKDAIAQDNKPVISRTKEFISTAIASIDNVRGWKYSFQDEKDFNTFLDLLTCYFEGNTYSLPEKAIRLKHGCKTRFAPVFNIIWKELKEKPLNSDREYFNIIRALSHFENETNEQIYKAITRL